MATLELSGVVVVKAGRRVLDGVDLDVADGELVAIIGPSGSGKTTLLRVAAGLDRPHEGEVRLSGHSASDEIKDRNVAMVYQGNVLYPNRDVAANIAFPLEMRRQPKAEIKERIEAEGRALHLTQMLNRNPTELSAGHQQLVQIARALVRAPDLFLMDEPLARLDARRRVEMRSELRLVQKGYGVTTLYVTNDPVEAMAVADRLAVLVGGRLVQIAAPAVVYGDPASQIVAQLTGDLSTLRVTVTTDEVGSWLRHETFRLRAWAPALASYEGVDVVLGLRPEQVEVDDAAPARAVVTHIAHHGPFEIVDCRVGDDVMTVRTQQLSVRPGDDIGLRVVGGHVFDPIDGRTVMSWS